MRSHHHSPAEISLVLDFMKKHPELTQEEVALNFNVDKSTINRWLMRDLSGDALAQRKFNSAHHKFSRRQEDIMAGWILCRDISQKSTIPKDFKAFIYLAFGVYVSPPWISRFVTRQSFSLKLPAATTKYELTPAALDKAQNFLETINFLDFPPENIVVFDKTFLRSNPENAYHIAPKGR